jgi:hypothetical protein
MAVSLPELFRFRERVSTLARKSGNLADGRVFSGIEDSITLDAFSGADISCVVSFPQQSREEMLRAGLDPDLAKNRPIKQFAELQTLTISSARSISPVRRLGEAHVHKYTRGARTIAGSLIFTNFNRDVFADFYKMHPGDSFLNSSVPFHVDQLPEFHIIISAANEFGTFANMALINVTLTNFGTTMSVHDLMVESTYTYVAQLMFPFVSNSLDFTSSIRFAIAAARGLDVQAFSEIAEDTFEGLETLSPLYGFEAGIQGSPYRDAIDIYDAWKASRK